MYVHFVICQFVTDKTTSSFWADKFLGRQMDGWTGSVVDKYHGQEVTVCLRGGDQKKFLFWVNQWFYLVSLVQKIGDPIFGLFSQSAINEANWAISRPGCPKLVDPTGFRLDLGGIHPGGCVSSF